MNKIEEVLNERTGQTEVFLNGKRLENLDNDHTTILLEILKKLLTINGERGEEIDLSHIEELLIQILDKTGEVSFDEAVQQVIVENNNLTNQLRAANNLIDKLNTDVHILLVNEGKLRGDLKTANIQLKETRAALANTIRQKNELSEELRRSKDENNQLKDRNREQSEQITELKESNTTKDATIRKQQERINELTKGDLAKENNELKMCLYRLDNELYQLKNRCQNAAADGWSRAVDAFRNFECC